MSPPLRPARSTDAGKTAAILERHYRDNPWIPNPPGGVELIDCCATMIDRGWVTIAQGAGRVAGFIARDGAQIHALYVAEGFARRGLGRLLLSHAKEQAPALALRTLRDNTGARRFYNREGFVQSGVPGICTDTGLPDIPYAWQAEDMR